MPTLANGIIFAVPLPDGTFLCGRVMLDLYGCVKRRLFSNESPLVGLGRTYLVEMYSTVSSSPKSTTSPLMISGAYVESSEVGTTWPIIGSAPIDPNTVEFPETLIGVMHDTGCAAFECGEIRIPIPISYHDYQDRIAVVTTVHSAFLWPYTCLRLLGREPEVPSNYQMATLKGSDLRSSSFRKEIYNDLPFPMSESYHTKQRRMGLNLDRLYE